MNTNEKDTAIIAIEQFEAIERCMRSVYLLYYSMNYQTEAVLLDKEELIKTTYAEVRSILNVVCHGHEVSDNEMSVIYASNRYDVEILPLREEIWEEEYRNRRNTTFSAPGSLSMALVMDTKFGLGGKNSKIFFGALKKLFELVCDADNDYKRYFSKAKVVEWMIEGIYSLIEARSIFLNEIQRPVVKSKKQIIDNINVLEKYLSDMDSEINREFALDRIKKGTCFIAILGSEGYRFYPSRFIGYLNNSRRVHEIDTDKDGRITNKAIEDVLRKGPIFYQEMEDEYYKYCNWLRIKASNNGAWGVQRKYWVFDSLTGFEN